MTRANLAPPRAVRDPHREALAAAITDRNDAERKAQAAAGALQAATDRKREAEQRRDALLPRDDTADEFESAESKEYGTVFAESLRAGNPLTADELDQARRDHGAALKVAERDVEVWERTRASCEAIYAETQRTLEWRKRAVERAARTVFSAPADVERLAAELKDAKALLLEKVAAFQFMLGCFEDSIEGVAARRRFENVLDLDIQPRSHPNYARFAAAFEKLKDDADAPLP